MKEDIRAVFRQWCIDQKLIVSLDDENLLINELFNIVREKIRDENSIIRKSE